MAFIIKRFPNGHLKKFFFDEKDKFDLDEFDWCQRQQDPLSFLFDEPGLDFDEWPAQGEPQKDF